MSYHKSVQNSKPSSISEVIIFLTIGPVVWRPKQQQLIGHFFSDHPRRIQLQHCLEISEITVYLRKNNQEPI